MQNEYEQLFFDTLVSQLRALDQYGVWKDKSDADILIKKYVKTKEQLKKIPLIDDVDEAKIKEIRLIYQAIALAFEQRTKVMANVVMEMNHEGFGRAVVLAEKYVIADKSFKDAHRFHFRTLEKLVAQGGKQLEKAVGTYKQLSRKD